MGDSYWDNIGKKAEEARNARFADMPKESGAVKSKAKKGHKLWVCHSCKSESWDHWTAVVRAARMRCPSCGSMNYEPKTKEAKDDMADLRGVRDSVKGRKGTGTGLFVIGDQRDE